MNLSKLIYTFSALGLLSATPTMALPSRCDGFSFPKGTYQSTCYDCKDNKGTLSATCQTSDKSKWVKSSISLTQCQSIGKSIRNNDGILACE